MKACLFDIDGTLVQTGGAGQVAFAEAFGELFGVPALSGQVAFAGRSDRAIAMDLLAAHDVEPTSENWARFREAYLRRLPSALKTCQGRVLPGVHKLLAELQEMTDVHIGLLTGNMREAAEHKLSHYGLWEHFAFGGYGDEHLDRNDIAAAAHALARDHHNGAPAAIETVVVIGDTPNDIRCGRSIGAKTVAVPTGMHSMDKLATHEPDLLVETLEDCEELLAWFD